MAASGGGDDAGRFDVSAFTRDEPQQSNVNVTGTDPELNQFEQQFPDVQPSPSPQQPKYTVSPT